MSTRYLKNHGVIIIQKISFVSSQFFQLLFFTISYVMAIFGFSRLIIFVADSK